jgi:hypothetical protein
VTGAGTPPYTSLLSFAATVTKKGTLALTLSCSNGTSACTGTIWIRLVEHLKHDKSKTVLLASARYTLRAASSAKSTLTLSSYARVLLAKAHTLHATATITAISGTTATKNTSKLTIHS